MVTETILALVTGALATAAYFLVRESRIRSELATAQAESERSTLQRAEAEQLLASTKAEQEKASAELQRISGLTTEQARDEAIQQATSSISNELASRAKVLLAEANLRAVDVVLSAVERTHVTTISESTTAIVPLPSDDVKGRIIGREGRNIRAFEQATGTELLLDATPGSVLISCFDPFRRETARVALMNLIVDGRIHPTRIEEIVVQSQQSMRAEIAEAGRTAAAEAKVEGLAPAVIQQLGLLRFRSSVGQNVLSHSVEVAQIAANLAAELGFDDHAARAAGLLHDIGKGLGEAYEGPHALTGMRFLTEHRIDGAILHAVAAHHYDVIPETPEARIIIVADAISASRPGARKENLENFATRLGDLEQIALKFPGVERAYAIQSGRELRVIVRPDDLNDQQTAALAQDIASEISSGPRLGMEVLVTVIREVRAQSKSK